MSNIDKQAQRMRNYLNTAVISGVKLLHLTTDELSGLLDELEAAARQNGYLREQRDEWERKAISNFEECAEMSARIEELESQRKLAFTTCNRWADKFREAEKRIAELEALAKSVKFDPIPMEELGNKSDGKKHPYMFGAGYNSAVVHCESVMLKAFAAAGIGSQPVSHRDELPKEEIECDICGHVSTDPEGRHHCSEDNSND